MSSSERTSSIKADDDDLFPHVTFNCWEFFRSVSVERPRSRRKVHAEQCVCVDPTKEEIDRTKVYTISFYETWDDEAEEKRKSNVEEGFFPDEIGVLMPDQGRAMIRVPPSFMNILWDATLIADGVTHSIQLEVKKSMHRLPNRWAVIDVNVGEKISPPRTNSVVDELRIVQTQLKLLKGRSGIIVVAIGVLVALWIAHLWR
jgi:hypothetical protein